MPHRNIDAADFDAADLEARVRALEAQCDALRHDQDVLALGLSHDLRSPLRAIESFSYLLEQRAEQLDDQARDHLRRIREASARVARLVSRLNTYLQAGSAPLDKTDVDLPLLADWCIAELRDADPQREPDIGIKLAPGLQVRGDERLLRTVLKELLHNAWTYAAGDRPARIRIEGERADDGVHLRIRDDGIGFDSAVATKLGEPFQRLHVATHSEGTGLGIAIATRIVERHGGTLRIEGREGAGTVAHLVLPT